MRSYEIVETEADTEKGTHVETWLLTFTNGVQTNAKLIDRQFFPHQKKMIMYTFVEGDRKLGEWWS